MLLVMSLIDFWYPVYTLYIECSQLPVENG